MFGSTPFCLGSSNSRWYENSPVYEAVNKESRKNFFTGMHTEFVGTRAPRAAAFVCFNWPKRGENF